MPEQEPQVPYNPTCDARRRRDARTDPGSGLVTTYAWVRSALAGRWRSAGRWNGNWYRGGNG
jgi:hypothetical protein